MIRLRKDAETPHLNPLPYTTTASRPTRLPPRGEEISRPASGRRHGWWIEEFGDGRRRAGRAPYNWGTDRDSISLLRGGGGGESARDGRFDRARLRRWI